MPDIFDTVSVAPKQDVFDTVPIAPKFSDEDVRTAHAKYVMDLIPFADKNTAMFSRQEFAKHPELVSGYLRPAPYEKPIGEAAIHGFQRAGVSMVKGLAGGVKAVGEFIDPGAKAKERPVFPALTKFWEKQSTTLTEWSNDMLAGVKQYYKQYPEEAIQITPDAGYYKTLQEYVSKPQNIVQGLIESAPMMLEAGLGTVVAGPVGSIAAMGLPIAGDVYGDAREKGTEPLPALAQALLTGAGEAVIEQWTFSRKLGLAQNFKKMVTKGLPKMMWEGIKAFFRGTAEEGSQEFNRNFWNWLFTDRSQAWSANVTESMAAGGPMELIMSGGFAAAGMTGPQVSDDQKIQRIEKIRGIVENTSDLTPGQKQEIGAELDKAAGEVGKPSPEVSPVNLKMKFDQLSSEMKKQKTGSPEWFRLSHQRDIVSLDMQIGPSGELTGPPKSVITPPTTPSVAVSPTQLEQGAKYGLVKEDVISKLNSAEERYRELKNSPTEGRTATDKAELAFLSRNRTDIEAILAKETEPGPQILRLRASPLDVMVSSHNLNGGSTIDINTGKPITSGYSVAISKAYEQIIPGPTLTRQDLESYRNAHADVLATDKRRTVGTWVDNGQTYLDVVTAVSSKKQALKMAQDNNQLVVFDLKNMKTITTPDLALEVSGKAKNIELRLGHQYPQVLGWDENQRRTFNFDLTGKLSMKDMTTEERKFVVDAMRQEILDKGLSGKINPDDLTGLNVVVGGEQLSVVKMLNDAVVTVAELSPNQKSPVIMKKPSLIPGRGLFTTIRDLVIGSENYDVSSLVNTLAAGKENSLTKILNDYRLRSMLDKDGHYKEAVTLLRQGFKEANITPDDLKEFSSSNNPRFQLLKTIGEAIGKSKTKYYTVDINGKTVQLSMGNLIQFYLLAAQEDGMKHLTESGIVFYKNSTGPLSLEKIAELQNCVDSNPKAKAIANILQKIVMEHNVPNLNAVSQRIGNFDIANEKNWWHLEVFEPRLMRGKATYAVSLLENKGIFRPRLHTGEGALVLRDVFDVWGPTQTTTSEYIGMAEWLRAANMILNHRPFIDTITTKGFDKIRTNLITVLERAQGVPGQQGIVGELLGRVLNGAYRGVLNFNLNVIGSQYISTVQYAGIVDKKYYKYIGSGANPSTIKEMLDKNPFAWDRFYMAHQSIEMAELGQLDSTLRIFQNKTTDINKTGVAMQFSDLLALADGWKIAKAWTADNLKGGTENPEYWNATNVKAIELWTRTQSSWDKWNRSMITSDPASIKRVLFLFRSYFEKGISMCHDANIRFQNSEKSASDVKDMSKVYGAVFASMAMTSLMRTAIMGLVWQKRKTVWDFIGDAVTSPLSLVAIFGNFLQMGATNFVKILAKEKPQQNYNPLSPLSFETIANTLIGTDHFSKATAYYMIGETDKAEGQMKSGMKSTWKGVGLWMGLPVYEINRLENAIVGEEENQPKGMLSRKP